LSEYLTGRGDIITRVSWLSQVCRQVRTLTVSTAAVSPRSLLFLTDATIDIAAYAAAFLFAVLVAAVSSFGFSLPYKQQ